MRPAAVEPPLADLAELDPGQADTFGGKASGLARLIGMGLAVPEGFALKATLLPPDAWPDGVLAEFRLRAARLLAAGPVAVRSSAIGEDGGDRSYAGQFTTVLGATTVDEVVVAATACIASGASGRAASYRAGTGSAATEGCVVEPIPVGVVVQRMVAAAVAGVAFTCDPTGHDPGLHIEAVRGLGDSLVSGRAQPERWRVYRAGTGSVEAYRDGGSTAGPGAILDSAAARQVAATAWSAAVKLGSDLDLEWAIDQTGKVHWLQARPVTAALRWRPPAVARSSPEADDGPVTVWGNWNVRENMPDPLTPLGWSIWRDTVVPVVTRGLSGLAPGSPAFAHAHPLDLVGGRVYFNMNALLAFRPLGRTLPRMLGLIDNQAGITTRMLMAQGVLEPRRIPRPPLRARLRSAFVAAKAGRDPTLALRPQAALRALAEAGDRIDARPPVSSLDDADLLQELLLFSSPAMGALLDGLGMASIGFFVWLAADHAFKPWQEARRLLPAGLTGNPTTEISLAVDTLVEAALPLGDQFEQDKDWQARLAEFLARFGHRTAHEAELSNPRWSEDPAFIVDLVRQGMRTPDRVGLADKLKALAERRSRAIEYAIRQAAPWKRPLMRWLERATLLYSPLRDAPKHHAMRALHRVRLAALQVGHRLCRRGILAAREDVFFLEHEELVTLLAQAGGAAVADPRALVTTRREEHCRAVARPLPDFVRSDGVPVPDPSAADPIEPGVLRGVGVGTGRGRGSAAILTTPDPERLEPGSVLVVEFADPGWTPLFPLASAVVMEVGGTMCHAAVVARELGIPAVFGVRGATRLIADGAEVAVDGDSGTVRLAAPELEAS